MRHPGKVQPLIPASSTPDRPVIDKTVIKKAHFIHYARHIVPRQRKVTENEQEMLQCDILTTMGKALLFRLTQRKWISV